MLSDDLFAGRETRVHLEGGELLLIRQWLDGETADSYFQRLRHSLAWERSRIAIAGRRVSIPRLNAWYGDPGTDYRYSGRRFRPRAWNEPLLELRQRLQATLDECGVGLTVNSLLANLYRDGSDSVSWHADDEAELGPRPQIASVSLGATRRFVFRQRRDGGNKYTLFLEHGSLLLMLGDLQRHWLHALPKTRKSVGERINLTFRQVYPVTAARQ